MAEKIIVRQTRNFETEFFAQDPEKGPDAPVTPVEYLYELTPYGILLAGLGSCTTIILHTYAQHHGLKLDRVETVARYERSFIKDCEKCEEPGRMQEQITLDVKLFGELSHKENEKLFKIALQCPIHRMLKTGIKMQMRVHEAPLTSMGQGQPSSAGRGKGPAAGGKR
jgi:uncharacterized OsmC-like protein